MHIFYQCSPKENYFAFATQNKTPSTTSSDNGLTPDTQGANEGNSPVKTVRYAYIELSWFYSVGGICLELFHGFAFLPYKH